jgi:hypothetical protein
MLFSYSLYHRRKEEENGKTLRGKIENSMVENPARRYFPSIRKCIIFRKEKFALAKLFSNDMC